MGPVLGRHLHFLTVNRTLAWLFVFASAVMVIVILVFRRVAEAGSASGSTTPAWPCGLDNFRYHVTGASTKSELLYRWLITLLVCKPKVKRHIRA